MITISKNILFPDDAQIFTDSLRAGGGGRGFWGVELIHLHKGIKRLQFLIHLSLSEPSAAFEMNKHLT